MALLLGKRTRKNINLPKIMNYLGQNVIQGE